MVEHIKKQKTAKFVINPCFVNTGCISGSISGLNTLLFILQGEVMKKRDFSYGF